VDERLRGLAAIGGSHDGEVDATQVVDVLVRIASAIGIVEETQRKIVVAHQVRDRHERHPEPVLSWPSCCVIGVLTGPPRTVCPVLGAGTVPFHLSEIPSGRPLRQGVAQPTSAYSADILRALYWHVISAFRLRHDATQFEWNRRLHRLSSITSRVVYALAGTVDGFHSQRQVLEIDIAMAKRRHLVLKHELDRLGMIV
jgi:hypothetical protein